MRITVEPGYTHETVTATDAAGQTTVTDTDSFEQNYALAVDRQLTDRLELSLGGLLHDQRDWREAEGAALPVVRRGSDGLFARLTMNTPALSWGLGADRRRERISGQDVNVVTENLSAYALWKPLELPELDLRLSRANTYDAGRDVRDTTTDAVAMGVRLRQAGGVNAHYNAAWIRVDERLARTVSSTVDQSAYGSWSGVLLGGRTTAYVNATLQAQNFSTQVGSPEATVTQPRAVVSGYSGVEALPATPTQVTLAPNGALVNGDRTESAAVNLGFGPSVSGDRDPRAVGGSFADEVTDVNTLYLWLDRALPEELYLALGATAQVYASDDNRTWTVVTLTPSVSFTPFERRLVIAFPTAAARYLKVSLRPLELGVTSDVAYREIFVTELQAAEVFTAEQLPRRSSSAGAAANAYQRTLILKGPELSYDLALSGSRSTERDRPQYGMTNGLSLSHRFWNVSASARGARVDEDAGSGHERAWEWSAGLSSRPVPTASWSLVYSGRSRNYPARLPVPGGDGIRNDELTHSVSAFGRADWYPGVSSQASMVGAVVSLNDQARTATSVQASASTSVTPNRWVSTTFGGVYDWTIVKDVTRSDVITDFARVDASLTLTPAPALSASGTLSRILLGQRTSTFGNLQLNYFPLRGDLQLSFGYTNTLDTAADATTSQFNTSLRWNVRRGVSLTGDHRWLRNVSPVQRYTSRVAGATLLITL